MDSGYYAACAGLAAETQALELVAHNLANTSTTGFRGEQSTFRSLIAGTAAVQSNPLNAAINNFGVLNASHLDLAPGSLTATGNPLDFGIAGSAFFVVQSGQDRLYTRDGSFHLTASGQLVTAEGDAVLGELGPITLPAGAVTVSSDGSMSVNGELVGKLRLAEFAPGTDLQPAGNSLYSAPQNSAVAAAASSVQQGVLESSNVSAVGSVVELITVQRNAEMLGRALSAFDSQMNQTATQDLPRV